MTDDYPTVKASKDCQLKQVNSKSTKVNGIVNHRSKNSDQNAKIFKISSINKQKLSKMVWTIIAEQHPQSQPMVTVSGRKFKVSILKPSVTKTCDKQLPPPKKSSSTQFNSQGLGQTMAKFSGASWWHHVLDSSPQVGITLTNQLLWAHTKKLILTVRYRSYINSSLLT